MSRCELTGKGPVAKNIVSHSNIKTKSRSLPNIQKKKFFSSQLGRFLQFKAAVSAIRDIDKIGAFDTFLLRQSDKNLSLAALRAKRKILKKISKGKTTKAQKEKGETNEGKN